jgi:large subunit ribosomal protein L18e
LRCNLNSPPTPCFSHRAAAQGIDLEDRGRSAGHRNRKAAVTGNVYHQLLVKLYSFLARRTDSGFNGVVLKRLISSRINRVPMGLARVARYMAGKEGKIAVVVASITDDVRLDGHAFPALKIAALRFTEAARARITKAGGECLTFDQLAQLRPRGEDTVLLRGRKNARVATRYFGTPGASGSTTRPRVESKGRKFEKARGRRKSRGFKV